jgi:hypothetical protein
MGRRNQNPKGDHNLPFRRTYIHEADRIMADCMTFTADLVGSDEATRRRWRRAAKLYERAADFYRRASLGIMGTLAWQKAAACYATLGMHEDASRCTHKADTIRVFWSDDEASYSENQGGQS